MRRFPKHLFNLKVPSKCTHGAKLVINPQFGKLFTTFYSTKIMLYKMVKNHPICAIRAMLLITQKKEEKKFFKFHVVK